ncbi:hypothetical protein VQ056_07105 [Paenibacillus sp. JTLBN-2024]
MQLLTYAAINLLHGNVRSGPARTCIHLDFLDWLVWWSFHRRAGRRAGE